MNLIVGWKLLAFRRNSSISFLLVWHADMTSSKIFSKDWLGAACPSISLIFYFGHEDVSKGCDHFRAHGCSMGLKMIFPVKLKRVLFPGFSCNIRLSISLKNPVGTEGFPWWDQVICSLSKLSEMKH